MAGILKSYGVRRTDSLISFMVVGPKDLCKKVSEGLHQNSKERKWKIVVHQCESLSQALKSKLDFCVDFIIFTFDLRATHSLSEVENNISLIDEHYIISGCTCLVSTNGISSSILGITQNKLRSIRDKYNIHFLSGNVSNLQACSYLGSRILNIAEAVLGITSGVPVVYSYSEYNER